MYAYGNGEGEQTKGAGVPHHIEQTARIQGQVGAQITPGQDNKSQVYIISDK